MGTQTELTVHTAGKKMKILKESDPDVMKHKLWRFLEQRGFAGEIIRRTVDALNII